MPLTYYDIAISCSKIAYHSHTNVVMLPKFGDIFTKKVPKPGSMTKKLEHDEKYWSMTKKLEHDNNFFYHAPIFVVMLQFFCHAPKIFTEMTRKNWSMIENIGA